MIVRKIEAIHPVNNIGQSIRNLYRVAAYCRVSTEADEQANSYEAQIEHYTKEIAKHNDWLNAGIYADKGITGTCAKKRPEFQKMISKCKQGKIDLIMVKSISRFARNTVDCLEYVRELKELGIGVIFEKENINTLTETSEAMITIMGYFAQAESESISKNVTWGIRHGFSEGKVNFTCDIYGYRRIYEYNENGKKSKAEGKLLIVEEEAEAIREIFNLYLTGASTATIANRLNERGFPNPGKTEKWLAKTVQRILRNEKYKGDVITQKTYCIDLLNHKRAKNTGQLPQHYIEDHHPAIVSREIFDAVQIEYARRNAKKRVSPYSDEQLKKSKYSSKYVLTELLVCGECGSPYRRCTWTSKNSKRIVWRCTTRLEHGKDKCPHSHTISEESLHSAILKSLSNLIESKDKIKDEIKAVLASVLIDTGADMNISALEAQVKDHENDLMQLVQICAEEGNTENHKADLQRISKTIAELKNIIEIEKTKLKPNLNMDSRVEQVFELIDKARAAMENFDDGTIRQLIAQIMVNSKTELTIILKNGYRTKATL